MRPKPCSVEVAYAPNALPRGVGFLIYPGISTVVARETFYGLLEEEQDYFRVSFEYWAMGRHDPRRYHGWDKSAFGGDHTHCFVFKQDEHRLYGFLDHPKENVPGYYFCVLVAYAWKVKTRTERKHLILCDQMRNTMAVRIAAREPFLAPEKGRHHGRH